jgi:hypothetical protein
MSLPFTLRKLHFKNVLSTLKTSVSGESRNPSNRVDSWSYLGPRTIVYPLMTLPTPLRPFTRTEAGCLEKEASSFQQQTTAWRHNLKTGDQTERSHCYFLQNGSRHETITKHRFLIPWNFIQLSRTLPGKVDNYIRKSFHPCLPHSTISVINSGRTIGWDTLHARYRHKQV